MSIVTVVTGGTTYTVSEVERFSVEDGMLRLLDADNKTAALFAAGQWDAFLPDDAESKDG